MPQPLTDAINALTAYANTVTGKTPPDTTLSDAVATLASGYGTGGLTIDDIASNTYPNNITITVDISSRAFDHKNVKNVTIASGVKINTYAFATSTIETLNAPLLTTIDDADYAFDGCTRLYSVEYGANSIGAYTFRNCKALVNVVFKEATTVYTNAFNGCTNLVSVDLCKVNNFPRQNSFNGCTSMNVLILRANVVAPLSNINIFTNTPFASGKAGGTLYVPQSLKSSYQSASGWSTILGYANNSIQAIEGSYYETHYADGTPIE